MTATTHHASKGHRDPDPDRLIQAHQHACSFYRDHLLRADGPRRYLTHRGLGQLAQPHEASWYLGYAPPEWSALVNHLTRAGYTQPELLAAGLCTRSTRTGRLIDIFRDRIMFPIHDLAGNPIAFLGRAAPTSRVDVPKYVNTPDTAIYHKGHTLYGAGEQAQPIASGAAPVLVEGPIDVLAVALARPDHQGVGIAACGTAITAHHAAAIAAMPGATRQGVTTALDNDPAGHAATDRAWRLLSAHRGIALFAATLPEHTDPGDLIATAAGADTLRRALGNAARPLAQAVIDIRLDAYAAGRPDLLRWPETRIAAARALAGLITDLPAPQVIALTRYIAIRTHTTISTVAAAVIERLDQPPLPPPHTPRRAFKQPTSAAAPPRPGLATDGPPRPPLPTSRGPHR